MALAVAGCFVGAHAYIPQSKPTEYQSGRLPLQFRQVRQSRLDLSGRQGDSFPVFVLAGILLARFSISTLAWER